MRADCLNLMCRCPCDENDACGRWWDLSSLGVPPRNRRACSHVSRLPESYQLGIRSTGFAGGVQPGGGIHCSRTGALGHGPLIKCGAPPPPTAGHSLFEAGAAVPVDADLPVRLATRLSQKLEGLGGLGGAGGDAAGGGGLTGMRRSPLSYHESTGFLGGVQPGGGIHCSRTGALGHGPLMKCGAPPPPTAGHSLFEETGGADWGAGAGGAGAAAGDGAESLFCWLTAAPRPRIATAAAPATWGSMVDGSKAAKGMVVREGPPTRPGVFGATRKPSARECTTKGATMSGSISAEGPLRSEI